MRRVLLLLLLALPVRAAEVRVLAAASLTDVLQEIAKTYEPRSGDRIVFSFGASSLLARQIEAGAPADLFLSADERSMNRVKTRVRASVLSNTLVVVVPKDGKAMRQPRELLAMRSIALAEPSSVPAGIYAREWLQRLQLWSAMQKKVIPTDNVRSALAAVATGNADAAIVYRTDARISSQVRVAYVVHDGPKISYPFALLADAEQPKAARRFLDYLRGSDARAVFLRHGFDVLR
ncbi:MAG TPA: molybdate ABC transporter substrate-binding protein [Thermoanaerobaculia bacterium]|nr:molybdate ABC transporter substrate-binding protein [Thermoanaerobaculia bacterium]